MSYTPPFLPPASPPQLPLVPPKKHHRGRNWAIAMSAFVLMAVIGLSFAFSRTLPSTGASAAATTIPATTIPATTIPATTIPATTIPATTIPRSPDELFLADLYYTDSSFHNGNASALVFMATVTCTDLMEGGTLTMIAEGFERGGGGGMPLSERQIGIIMGAGIAALCPQYSYLIP